jgi:hypothetical protein
MCKATAASDLLASFHDGMLKPDYVLYMTICKKEKTIKRQISRVFEKNEKELLF